MRPGRSDSMAAPRIARVICLLLFACTATIAEAQTVDISSYEKVCDAQPGFGGLLDPGDEFGSAAAPLGDFDGDGVEDIVVGVPNDELSGSAQGAIRILFLNTDGTVKSQNRIHYSKVGSVPYLLDYVAFGSSVSSLDDLDGDGVTDLAVGAPRCDCGGIDFGQVFILFITQGISQYG